MSDKRDDRAANYAAKKAAGFRCEGEDHDERCSATDNLLAVDVRALNGAVGVFCERHIDRRKHVVRPHQWDEAARIQAALR